MNSLNNKIAIGAVWTLLARFTVKSLGIISTFILARLLLPEDFGLIALSMLLITFLQIFTSFGFDVNIIQRKNVTSCTLNSAWTCKVLFGLTLSCILYLSSFYINEYFDNANLKTLIRTLCFLPLINSFQNIGFVLYRKKMDLKKEFSLEVTSKIISFFVTIISAYFLQNYWALVIGMYVNATSKLFMSYYMHNFRPRIDTSEIRELFQFSKWLLLNNLLIFFNHKVTDFIIAKETSTEELGYYSIGYEISNLPTTELVFPLSRALFPGYATVSHDKEKIKALFLNLTAIIAIVAAPISFGMASVSEELVLIFLGEKWLAIIPILSVLVFYGLIRAIVSNVGTVFVALGAPKIPVVLSIVRFCLIIPLLLYFVPEEQALGGAKSVLYAACLTAPIGLFIIARKLGIRLTQFIRVIFPPLILSSMMFLIISYRIDDLLIDYATSLVFIVKILFGFLFYVITSLIYNLIFDKNYIFLKLTKKAFFGIKKTAKNKGYINE